MQIVYHIGAECTDGDRLLKSLLKNSDPLSQQGIKVPGPGRYRRLLEETIQNLDGRAPAPETRDILIDAILDEDSASRLVLSFQNFICGPNRIFEDGIFYGRAAYKLSALRGLFPQDELELCLSFRNPATWLPAVYEKSYYKDLGAFLCGLHPEDLRWSEVIALIQDTLPGVPLTVWCMEDTPLIWAQLIREISGVDPLTKISGGFDLLNAIMAPEGMKRFLTYLKTHPPQTEVQKRRIIQAFLERYALEDEVEEEVDLPGWDAAMIDHLTELYDEDMLEVARMPGVTFIAP